MRAFINGFSVLQLQRIALALLIAGMVAPAVGADDVPVLAVRLAAEEPVEGWKKMTLPEQEKQPARVVFVSPEAIVTQADIQEAGVTEDQTGRPSISITLTEQGGEKMRKATDAALREYRDKVGPENSAPQPDATEIDDAPAREATDEKHPPRPLMAVVFEGELLLAPRLHSVIGARCVIAGRFTPAEAQRIATAIAPPE